MQNMSVRKKSMQTVAVHKTKLLVAGRSEFVADHKNSVQNRRSCRSLQSVHSLGFVAAAAAAASPAPGTGHDKEEHWDSRMMTSLLLNCSPSDV